MAARAEVAAATRERYGASGRAAKGAILDEFVALTGLHRKHAIRVLSAKGPKKLPRGRPRTRYGAAVKEALVALWEASDRVCSKRLAPMIPVLLPARDAARAARARRGPARGAPRGQPGDDRPAALGDAHRGGAGAQASGRLRLGVAPVGAGRCRSVPVGAGAHLRGLGRSAAGLRGGRLRRPLGGERGRRLRSDDGAHRHRRGLDRVRAGRDAGGRARAGGPAGGAGASFPFPLKGVDFDNDGAFMNEPVVAWCRVRGLEVTRSRA